MDNETTIYDYDAIDQCLAMMKGRADEIDNNVTTLSDDVQKIINAGWTGDTATEYQQSSAKLQHGLDNHREYLVTLRSQLQLSAERMAEADKRGGRGIAV
ncbi:WXG100 family type VII secretion target [Amycolatopsis japonica]|uniref:WXG100 family type VII secretion target n=1 Tax=Amycolatopsis japonica TaxID=208439 RepID=UPI00367332D8